MRSASSLPGCDAGITSQGKGAIHSSGVRGMEGGKRHDR